MPFQLPPGLRHIDDDEQALAGLHTYADRMAHHTKRLRVIQFTEGIEGVGLYKQKYPAARSIRVTATTIAYQPKPQGYDDFLCKVVDAWFISDTALAESNRATVERLNVAMAPRRFNPDNHFTKPVSASRLRKLADVFATHGAHLDTRTADSMSKIRAAVKSSKGKRSEGKPLGHIGHITDDRLIIGSQCFRVERYKDRDCIRVTAEGVTQRVYVTIVQKLFAGVGVDDPLSISSIVDIGELVSEPNQAPNDPDPSTVETNSPGDFRPAGPLSLTERMAARRTARLDAAVMAPSPVAEQPYSPAHADDPDADALALS